MLTETAQNTELPTDASPLIGEMFRVGAHIGYTRARRHPSVISFIFGKKNTLDVIDLTKTERQLETACDFAKNIAEKGGVMLFVGTKPAARDIVVSKAKEAGAFFVKNRWIGGLLTNPGEMRRRVEKLTRLKEQVSQGDLSRYTKKERAKIEKELKDLSEKFGGVEGMSRLPDALFIVDPKEEDTAVREAKKMKVPIVAVAGSDCDVREIEYPIVANDSGAQSIAFFVSKITDAYKNGRRG